MGPWGKYAELVKNPDLPLHPCWKKEDGNNGNQMLWKMYKVNVNQTIIHVDINREIIPQQEVIQTMVRAVQLTAWAVFFQRRLKKTLRRRLAIEKAIRPLQIKMKEMLNSPHNKRGKAFIESQISWAFE
tara:strand:+ start:205 stop:591 length:387 start_codon:yes stop_codon:yes gene_type:complete